MAFSSLKLNRSVSDFTTAGTKVLEAVPKMAFAIRESRICMKNNWLFLLGNFSAACGVVVLVLLMTALPAHAQLATADILGTVTDSTGAVIPDAKVTILNTGTGISASSKSDKVGEFMFSHVQIGTFKVTVEATGFKTFVTNRLTATTGDRVRVSAKLEIGSQVETVQVEATAAATLQTDTSNIVSQISADAVADLPLNGRNIYNLIGLQAGTSAGNTSSTPLDSRQTQSFSANGQSSMYNNNMIDGMDNNERTMGTVAVEPSVDALQEVKVETNLYSAEYSRTGGGIANLITKAGTNSFHGTLFEFMRNDAFDTYSWNSNGIKNKLRQNQFGGSLGGPILKNKAFFFGDYQGWRQVQGSIVKTWVPNQTEYDSIQSYASGSSSSITLADQWDAWKGKDPLTITADQISPLGLAYLLQAPAPKCATSCDSGNTYNWYGASNTPQNADTYDGRVDYHFDANNTLYGRFSYNKTTTTSQQGWPASKIAKGNSKLYTNYANLNPVVDTNLALDYVHVFSPQTLFEVKASFLRPNDIGHTNNLSWTLSDLGLSCDSDYCYNTSGVYGLPMLFFPTAASTSQYSGTTAPYAYNGDGGYSGYIENTFQYVASLTMNRKSHSIKAGVALMRRQINAPASSNTNLYFSAHYTGNALGDIAEGKSVYVSGEKYMVVPHYRMWEPSAYIQDDWRVTNALTLNLGVRYDIYSAWTERQGHISNFDLDSGLIASPSLLGSNQASPTANVNTDYGNIAPRIGFAYSLPHSTVLRGGWGLSYFPGSSNGMMQFQMFNEPFLWGMTCGNSGYTTGAACGSSKYGLPSAKYDLTLATDPTKYASENAAAAEYIMPNFKNSYLIQFNLQLQKEYKNQILTVGFVGSLGRRIPTQQNLNQPISSTSAYPMYSSAHYWMNNVAVSEEISGANSAWEGGEATYEWHNSRNLNASVNYTWARSEGQSTSTSKCVLYGCPKDNGSGTAVPVRGWQEYNYDGSTSHRAAGTISYNLPFGKTLHGPLGAVVKGWALNGTGYWNTGAWTQITSGYNQSGITTAAQSSASEYPNKVPGVSVKPKHQSLSHWVNEDAFKIQALGMLGNANKNLVQQPRSRDADLGVGKIFSMKEGLKLQFRAEAFDVTNTPNYGGASGGPGGGGGTFSISSYLDSGVPDTSTGFGNISSATGNRIMQFGLKLIY